VAGAVFGYGTSSTHAVYVIPPAWLGQRVIFQAVSYAMAINFGIAATVEVDVAGVSTVAGTPNTLTVGATTGAYIASGEALEFLITNELTHFAVEAAGTGGWRAWVTEPVY
jgi:hypothetical protein